MWYINNILLFALLVWTLEMAIWESTEYWTFIEFKYLAMQYSESNKFHATTI